MKATAKKCFDCGSKIAIGGVTVGRMTCDTVWTTICAECDNKFKQTKGYKQVMRLCKSINKDRDIKIK
jgi:DNA-directed RNA polymerase subunit RPC12/RpoP